METRKCFGQPEYPGLKGQWPVAGAAFYEYVMRLAEPFAVPCRSLSVPGGRVDTSAGFLTAVAALSIKAADPGYGPVCLVVPVCRSMSHNNHYLYAFPFLDILFGPRVEVVHRDRPGSLQLKIRDQDTPLQGVVLAEADSRRLTIPCVFNLSRAADIYRVCGQGDLKCVGHDNITPSLALEETALFCRPLTQTGMGLWTLPVVRPVVSLDPGIPLCERLEGVTDLVTFLDRDVSYDQAAGECSWGEGRVVVLSTEFGPVVAEKPGDVPQLLYDMCKESLGYNEADRRLATGALASWQRLPAGSFGVIEYRKWRRGGKTGTAA